MCTNNIIVGLKACKWNFIFIEFKQCLICFFFMWKFIFLERRDTKPRIPYWMGGRRRARKHSRHILRMWCINHKSVFPIEFKFGVLQCCFNLFFIAKLHRVRIDSKDCQHFQCDTKWNKQLQLWNKHLGPKKEEALRCSIPESSISPWISGCRKILFANISCFIVEYITMQTQSKDESHRKFALTSCHKVFAFFCQQKCLWIVSEWKMKSKQNKKWCENSICWKRKMAAMELNELICATGCCKRQRRKRKKVVWQSNNFLVLPSIKQRWISSLHLKTI